MVPLFVAIRGRVLLKGYAPDGDSIRFVPHARDVARLAGLRRASLLRRSATDGSVQLRLEGIDAPELHYEGACQPRGACARDALLAWLGVDVAGVRYAPGGAVIVSASPRTVPVTVLAAGIDAHGRVIAYLLPDARARAGARARHVSLRMRVTDAVLRATANYALVHQGHAYPLAYTSQPVAHRAAFRDAARRARRARLGVWSEDATARGFGLHGGLRALGPHGALVVPKLFRRCVDYLGAREREGAARGNFVDWLAAHGSHGAAGAHAIDRVVLPHAANVPFATLVRERDARISLAVDPINLVFVES